MPPRGGPCRQTFGRPALSVTAHPAAVGGVSVATSVPDQGAEKTLRRLVIQPERCLSKLVKFLAAHPKRRRIRNVQFRVLSQDRCCGGCDENTPQATCPIVVTD